MRTKTKKQIDYYQILGVSQDASLREIEKAYREKARLLHPDRDQHRVEETDANVEMKMLNEAYYVLRDPDRRAIYDQAYEGPVIVRGVLPTAGTAFGKKFRDQHKQLVAKYQLFPLKEVCSAIYLSEFVTNIYPNQQTLFFTLSGAQVDESGLEEIQYQNLIPQFFINIFHKFLQAKLKRTALEMFLEKLAAEIKRLKAHNPNFRDCPLYEGIHEIITASLNYAGTETDNGKLINAFVKITDYAVIAHQDKFLWLTPLFQSIYFRDLYKYALHCYWSSKNNMLSQQDLAGFDGKRQAAELLESFNERLMDNPRVAKEYRHAKLLNWFENYPDKTSEDYREVAYLILDWLPTIIDNYNCGVIANTFLQAAVYFQKSSLNTNNSLAIRMADEHIALELYQQAIAISGLGAPDSEFYIQTHSLKYIAHFNWEHPIVKNLIPALQKKCLKIADIFPFFDALQSNISREVRSAKTVVLLRRYLNQLVSLGEQEKNNGVEPHKRYVYYLYLAFEGCLKHWYSSPYSSEEEKILRRKLMQELLALNKWNFNQLDYNIKGPWLIVPRDEQGWLKPIPELAFPDRAPPAYFKSIHGLTIDLTTGETDFHVIPWKDGDPKYEKNLMPYDLGELIATKASYGFFSLDPVDPEMPCHPYNEIKFGPKEIYDSQLYHCMFLADYLLKFFTVGSEIQAKEPYDVRSIKTLINKLPKYLRKIITDYQEATHTGGVHRFWIESKCIEVAIDDENLKDKNKLSIALGEIKMVVKKHVMKYDMDGNLIDDPNEAGEGWNVYVLTQAQKENLDSNSIDKPALVFVKDSKQMYCMKEDGSEELVVINKCDNHLKKLFKLSVGSGGKIVSNSDNNKLLYQLTKEVCKQANMPHKFSPEYVFAQEFTIHYDEFSQYFPVFGRLREMSRATTLIRQMEIQHESNKNRLNLFEEKLKDQSFWSEVEKEIMLELRNRILNMVKTWQARVAEYKLSREQQLKDIYQKIKYDISSHYNDVLTALSQSFPKAPMSALKSFLNNSMQELLDELTREEVNNFPNQVASANRELNFTADAVRQAMAGDLSALINILVSNNIAAQKNEIRQEIKKCQALKKAFDAMGMGIIKISDKLETQCLWVPAAINHRVSEEKVRMVYGGVFIQPHHDMVRPDSPYRSQLLAFGGFQVYRVWGGDANPYGASWSLVNPNNVANFRDYAGLPSGNTGRFVTTGYVSAHDIHSMRAAYSLDGNRGGGNEAIILNSQNKVRVTGVYGANPPF